MIDDDCYDEDGEWLCEWEEQSYFTGNCTCDHEREDHSWGNCDVDDCECEAGWEE